jgi:ribosomal protein L14E/L6E/L27E
MDDTVEGGFAAIVDSSRPKSSRARTATRTEAREITADSEGFFWFEAAHNILVDGKRTHRGISSRELQQLKELVKSKFFTEKIMRDVVVKLNDENSEAPRLRAFDWACTNFAKGHPVVKLVKSNDGSGAIVDPNMAYEGELRKHHRLLFDPFRRGTHIFYEIDGVIQRTTAGQLTFIRWCLENGVDKYVEENLVQIRQHMSRATKRGRQLGKRRRELTKAPTRLVRGVLMTEYDISTDTAHEISASKAWEKNKKAATLAMELADEENVEKAKELAELLK